MNRKKLRKIRDKFFALSGLIFTVLGLVVLGVLITDIFTDGVSRISGQFLTGFPSRNPEIAGILPAIIGTICLVFIAITLAFPIGICAAIYLEEYAKKNLLTEILEINISNLAAIPSIVYGILGLGIFVYTLGLGRNVLSGGLTLGLLILPIIIVSTRESIRAIPSSFREASYAMGATKWQTISRVVLPAAFSGILTGIILAVSRAIGEAAPLIVVGGVTFISFLPTSPMDPFTALPLQIFNWVSYPQKEFHRLASAGIIVLLFLALSINVLAIFLRQHFRKKVKW
ncbi:MAG: Phosphate transport system permease protein PstA [candidate division WS2 bacterium]|nr:Phosphate transport system permease protein PstA [Candidatus Lithacetigena glycinireducens]